MFVFLFSNGRNRIVIKRVLISMNVVDKRPGATSNMLHSSPSHLDVWAS